MTFLDKLKQERPEIVGDGYWGGAMGCPHQYGYEKKDDEPCEKDLSFLCKDCWNRKMPEAKPASEKSPRLDILEISSKAYRLIGRIEGMTYRCMEPEAQNSLQDDIGKLVKIICELVDYTRDKIEN